MVRRCLGGDREDGGCSEDLLEDDYDDGVGGQFNGMRLILGEQRGETTVRGDNDDVYDGGDGL